MRMLKYLELFLYSATNINIIRKRTYWIYPLPPAYCTLAKMLKIMDDPLVSYSVEISIK